MLMTLNILYPVLAMLAMFLLAHKNRIGFLVFLFVEIIMLYLGVQTKQYGIAIMAILYFFMNIYSYKQWSKDND